VVDPLDRVIVSYWVTKKVLFLFKIKKKWLSEAGSTSVFRFRIT